MKNIVALDIDDCIMPSDINYFGRSDDSIKVFEINLVRLAMILEKYNMKVFITSSWAHIIEIKDKSLFLTSERNDVNTLLGFALLKKYIENYIIGLSCGDREKDIRKLQKEGNKIVILDDWKLQYLQDEDKTKNTLYIEMSGFIDGNVGFMIDQFMKFNKIRKRHNS